MQKREAAIVRNFREEGAILPEKLKLHVNLLDIVYVKFVIFYIVLSGKEEPIIE